MGDDQLTTPLSALVWQPDGGAAALRPDGLEMVTGGYDGVLALWNVPTGRLVRSWQAHRGWVWSCSYHPVRNVIVSTGADGLARVWDGSSGDLLAEFEPGGREFHSVAFSPDGELLATFGWQGGIVVWRSTTEPLLGLAGHQGWVSSVAFHPNGTQLVSTGGGDGTLRVWDLGSGELQHTVRPNDFPMAGCVFRPGTGELITVGGGGLHVWDAASWKVLRHWDESPADVLAVNPDGSMVATGSTNGVRLWDLTSGEASAVPLDDPTGVQWLGFSPDGRELAVRQVSSASWLDVRSGQTRRSAAGSIGAQVTAAAIGGSVLVTGGQDGLVRIWDQDRGAVRHTIAAHRDVVHHMVLRGAELITAGADGAVCVIDTVAGTVLRSWQADFLFAHRCFLRPGGAELITAGNSPGVALWRSASGDLVFRPLPELYRAHDYLARPDGSEIMLGQGLEGSTQVWDLQTGRLISQFQDDDPAVSAAALSPDGTVAVTGDYDGRVQWWDVAGGGRRRLSDVGLPEVSAFAFRADGLELLTGHVDGQLRAWDVQTGRAGRRFDDQYGRVSWCGYAGDGSTVLAGGLDRSVRMWDAMTTTPTGFRFEALPDGDAVVWTVPDGSVAGETPGAGRWLGRSVTDSAAAVSRWLPR